MTFSILYFTTKTFKFKSYRKTQKENCGVVITNDIMLLKLYQTESGGDGTYQPTCYRNKLKVV